MNTTEKGIVIELADGRVKEGVETQEFLNASDDLMADLRGLDGITRREVWQGEDGRFVDVVYWENIESMQRAMEIFPTLPSAKPFEALLDQGSISMRHLRQVRVYNRVEVSNDDEQYATENKAA